METPDGLGVTSRRGGRGACGLGSGRPDHRRLLRDAERPGQLVTRDAVKLYVPPMADVAEYCGVPTHLVNPASAGPAAHEAWRRFTVGTVEPIARILETAINPRPSTSRATSCPIRPPCG